MEDSKIIIDWYTDNNNLQVISLQFWMKKIRELHKYFQQIKAQHIYRNYNQDADQLSKEALCMVEDRIYYSQVSDGQQKIYERIDLRWTAENI
jgi:hypothetical protein